MMMAQKTVTGSVISAEDGEPIIGATVVVTGTTTGTVTDVDGNFSIKAPESAKTLSVSYVGMETQEVTITGKKLKVILSANNEVLDEVMVVAFGTSSKKAFTGSASVIKAEGIVKTQTSNVTSSLAGQVAGVQGLNTTGQPGEMATIRIRGIGSMNASNAPLYVIDGTPASSDAITTLSNQDIESVTVLKDASSAALYGARGANGVILITTKRGNTQDAKISVDAKWGTNRRAVPSYDVMTDPAMYYETFYKALNTFGGDAYANKYLLDAANGGLGYQSYTIPEGERLVGSNGKLNPKATLGYIDPKTGYLIKPDNWYDELFDNNNLRQEYSVNLSGSTDKMTYYTSATYLDDSGIISNSGFKRVTARTNVDYQAKKWLKISTNLSYSHADQKYPGESEYGNASSGNIFYVANNMAPIYPLYVRNADGSIAHDSNGYTMYDYGDGKVFSCQRAFMSQSNPASAIELDKEVYKKDIFTGKWAVVADLYDGLKATANVGTHYAGIRYQSSTNPFYGQYASAGGIASVEGDRIVTVDQQYLLTYNKSLNDHTIDALVGYENYKYTSSYVYGSKMMIYNPDIPEVSNGILSPNTASATTNYFVQGVLGQVKYNYANRYFVSASYRADASSRFAKDNRWGNFWSVGAAWDLKSESFMKDFSFIDMMKVKFSYGTQGNDALLTKDGHANYYPYTDQFSVSENNGAFAITMSEKGNPDITWETSKNLNAGIDFSLFNNRLNGTIEGWARTTEDMLYFKPVPASLGYSFLPVNIGSVRNAGIDFELNGDVYRSKDIKWNVYVNGSSYKNKILELSPELNGEWVEGTYIYKEGHSMYNRYLRSYAGVDPQTGVSLWYTDTDKDGNDVGHKGATTDKFASAKQYEYGDVLPKISGGFGTSVDAYGFDFSIGFNYQLGGEIFDSGYSSLMHGGSSSDQGHNWHMDILKAWTPENPDTNVPVLNTDYYANGTSDRFMTSSNYLTLQNITFGYSLPKQLLRKIDMEKVRVYFVADNIALISARKGLDPRLGFGASNTQGYSPIKSISGGISLTF